MPEKRVRIILCLFCIVLTVALGLFIWIMMDASSGAMPGVLRNSLFLVGGVTIVSQIIYALKGQVFEYDGRLAKRELLFSVICFQCIMQFGFGFSLYAVNQTTLQNESYDNAYLYFIELQQNVAGNTAADYRELDLTAGMPECVETVIVITEDGFSDVNRYFRFPISDGKLLMLKSQAYFNKHLQDFAVGLLMSLVISILMMIEFVYLAVKYLDNSIHNKKEAVTPVGYLRQFAFLFYFAGFLGSSFVPIIARDLCAGSSNANFIAGLPYSVEALANCVAILAATPVFRKKGWKPPYAAGIGIFVFGLSLSALSGNVYLFIIARAVVGIGYGLCWMTLRNVTTISGDRAENFASLTSGIYAGIMSGAAFGAVLADKVGYRNVLFMSVLLSIAAAVFPLSIRNTGKAVTSVAVEGEKQIVTAKDAVVFVIFLLAIVIPTCISEAFCSYVSPLYINELNLPTAYIGRVTLLYNLCIVYIGSALMMKLIKRYIKSGLFQNIAHMLFISLALTAAAYFGGFGAMLIASVLLGSADGFGFSVQNAYVLDTKAGKKIGGSQMLTYFSLFKKFGAMLGPMVFSMFLSGGIGGLGVMGVIYAICALVCTVLIVQLQKPVRNNNKNKIIS